MKRKEMIELMVESSWHNSDFRGRVVNSDLMYEIMEHLLNVQEKAGMLPPFVESSYPELITDAHFWEKE